MIRFKTINTKDEEVNRLQDAVEEAFKPLTSSTLIEARLISRQVLTAGKVNIIEHLLPNAYQTYVLAASSAPCSLFTSSVVNNMKNKVLMLDCIIFNTSTGLWSQSGQVIVDILVV